MAEKFAFGKPIRNMEESPNLGDDTAQEIGIRVLPVTCKECGAAWQATEGRRSEKGKFQSLIGAIKLYCIKCPAFELIDKPHELG
jgi:hypothetical protein